MEVDAYPTDRTIDILPSKEKLQHARDHLINSLPQKGIGLESTGEHILRDLVPGFNQPNKSSNYYGFVTGGSTPAAIVGDTIAVENDQNVQVHLPDETIATEVEDRALKMVCDLLDLPAAEWDHRTFTTGATASNVVGLACGREFILSKATSVAEEGIFNAMRMAGVEEIQVLTTVPHSSLRKAASVVGLGRSCVRDVSLAEARHRFDMEALKSELSKPKTASIVAVSCAEVNTGFFATNGEEMKQIRQLCDEYGAWLHIDAAFGLMGRVLPETIEYAEIKEGVKGLELADSITADAHKLLNVPYDCGIYLSRHLVLGTKVLQNTNAAYLSISDNTIPSPLNIGIENSRRFRALPVYATLSAYGLEGYQDMMKRQIALARSIAGFISQSSEFELLNGNGGEGEGIYIIVLFRARDAGVNAELVRQINSGRRIYVSGTEWEGRPAARFAVASWQVVVERDLALVRDVLKEVVK